MPINVKWEVLKLVSTVASIHVQDGDVTLVQNDQASATAELRV